jgi:hypothetical protein
VEDLLDLGAGSLAVETFPNEPLSRFGECSGVGVACGRFWAPATFDRIERVPGFLASAGQR